MLEYTKELLKILIKAILKILKIIICVAIIIIFPFTFPLFTRFLMHMHLYEGIEEFKNYTNMFYDTYFIIILLMGAISVFLIACNKDRLSRWLKNLKVSLKYKDAQIDASFDEVIEESGIKRNFIDIVRKHNKNDSKSDDGDIKSEVQAELQMKDNKKTKKDKKEKEQIEILKYETEMLKYENNNLRFYATYNIINKKTKELLNIIYCDKSIKLKDFKQRLESSYIDRNKSNKNINKKDLKKYANNKYETILEGLLYLEIIEITDDEIESIALTQYGEEFVEKYIENEVDDYAN